MQKSESYEAIWTLWSFLWFLGREDPKMAGSIFGMTEEDVSDKIAEVVLMVGMALNFAGLLESRGLAMDEHPIPLRLLAKMKHTPADQMIMAPYYWGLRALIASRREYSGTQVAQLISAASNAIAGLYRKWDPAILAQMLTIAYPDAMDYVREANRYFG